MLHVSIHRKNRSLEKLLVLTISFLIMIVFRTGDLGANWFAILSGSVDVCVPSETGKVRSLLLPLASHEEKITCCFSFN